MVEQRKDEHRTSNVQHRMLNEKETKRMTKDEQSSDEEKTGVMSCGLRVAGTRLKFTAETP